MIKTKLKYPLTSTGIQKVKLEYLFYNYPLYPVDFKVAINKIVEQNIEDLLLKVGDIIDEHEGVEHSNIERRIVVTPEKTDHAYSKRISSLPYPTLRTSKTESHEGPTSSSAKSLERLEETSKVISHNKAKKVLKSVGLNPFIPRYTNAPSSTAITKHVFNKPAGNIKTSVTSKSVLCILEDFPNLVNIDSSLMEKFLLSMQTFFQESTSTGRKSL